MEVDKKIKLEAIERENCFNTRIKVKKESAECIGCSDLQDKIVKVNEKCAHLERTVAFAELEKLQFADEVGKLKQRNAELQRIIQDSKEEREKLVVDNKALDSQKKKAESDLGYWKVKCRELEVKVKELEQKLSAGTTKPDHRTTPSKLCVDVDGYKGGQSCGINPTVKKRLNFSDESYPLQNGITSTPGSRPPVETIYIDDSDDDVKIVDASLADVDCKGQKRSESAPDNYEPTVEHQSDEEEASSFTGEQSFRMPKRNKLTKGVAQVVSSESESDDTVPLSRLWSMKKPVDGSCSSDDHRKTTPRRRLRRVGDIEEDINASGKRSRKSPNKQKNAGISENLNNTLLGDEMETDDSSCESESLRDFIVESSDASDSDSGLNLNDMSGSSSDDSSDESRSASEYHKIISGLRRERKGKLKWEYETDMLADFGKSAELCMKAICVLYRQQTSDEQSFKATIHRNGRGFSQIHASTGTALAEFLTGGNPRGDMTKTVKELQEYNSKGVELCQQLARHYSKQLFEIYKNEEDPFFHP